MSGVCLWGFIGSLTRDPPDDGMLIFGIPGLILTLATLIRLRSIHAGGSRLTRTTVLGSKELNLSEAAVAVRVSGAANSKNYTLYAHEGTTKFDITWAFSYKGAEKVQSKLQTTFWGQNGAPSPEGPAHVRALADEAHWKGQYAQVRAADAATSASSKHKAMLLVISLGVAFYALALAAALYFG